MDFTKEIGSVLFDGYWKGGANGDPKARQGKTEPKSFDEAIQQFPYMLGKIKSCVVMTDYDNPEAFQARLRIAEALEQHCIAIKSPHKGGHMLNVTSNTANAFIDSGEFCIPVDSYALLLHSSPDNLSHTH